MDLKSNIKLFDEIYKDGPIIVFIWTHGSTWKIEYVSKNIINLGYTPEEFLHGTMNIDSLIHQQDLPMVQETIRNSINNDNSYFEKTYRLKKKDNSIIWVFDHTSIIRDKQNNITHYFGYFIDITSRKLTG